MKATINCKKIEHIIYLTDDELNTNEKTRLSRHLATCSACRQTREKFLETRLILLLSNKDIPSVPEITFPSGIPAAIPTRAATSRGSAAMQVIRYVSTIAAVFLLILFSWEQSSSVHKIATLEKRVQSAVIPSEPGLIDRITLARSILNGKEWQVLAASLHISQTVDDPADLRRIKAMIESRISIGQTDELASIELFRNSLAFKRSSITLKNLIK